MQHFYATLGDAVKVRTDPLISDRWGNLGNLFRKRSAYTRCRRPFWKKARKYFKSQKGYPNSRLNQREPDTPLPALSKEEKKRNRPSIVSVAKIFHKYLTLNLRLTYASPTILQVLIDKR